MIDKYKIRNMNERAVLKQLIHHQPVSRASLSKYAKLNKATVTEIINTLMERELVIETGLGSSQKNGGRKPIMLELNRTAGYVISIDLGNTYISSILSNLNGVVVDSFQITSIDVNSDNVLDLIDQCVQRYHKDYQDSSFGAVSMVLAIHGIVHNNHITLSPNYNMKGIHLYEKLIQIYDFPIYFENEANLAAISHIRDNHEVDNIIVLSIHKGIGAGVIINRILYHGASGGAGELGHITLYPQGRPCDCGKAGCYERYCSTQVALDMYRQLKQTDHAAIEDIIHDYAANDAAVTDMMNQLIYDMAVGISTFISAFDPEIIYIISELFSAYPAFLSILNSKLETLFHRSIDLELSDIPFGATLIGASVTGIQNFLEIDNQVD